MAKIGSKCGIVLLLFPSGGLFLQLEGSLNVHRLSQMRLSDPNLAWSVYSQDEHDPQDVQTKNPDGSSEEAGRIPEISTEAETLSLENVLPVVQESFRWREIRVGI